MRKALALAAALLCSAPAAQSGQLSAGLERQMQGMDGNAEITVLVVLREQADIQTLNSNLRTTRASMETRHQAVIDELKDTAFRSQGPILAEMASRNAAGVIRGYTPYWLINAVTVATTVDGARELALRADVEIVEPNLVVELIEPVQADPEKLGRGGLSRAIGITPGVVAINARRVWEELGIDGSGALVGNMDTGVDGTHPALQARWRGNFAPASECWRDAVGFGDATPVDRHYHGTHVMGTITGQAPDDTIGVAPGALWIADNTINQGAGPALDSDVISGLQWFADPDGNAGTTDDVPDVVQHSWGVHEGFSGYFDCDSRWWTAIDNCEAAGVVNTWSAGNEGPGSQSLRSPADRATTPYNCFSVGSTEHSPPYTISDFSSRGPTGCAGTPWPTKPEISAPGSSIYSAQPGGGYQYLSGTSMAGPHVAGVVALMRSANPDVDVDTIKQILMDTATDLGAAGEDNTYGHGFVNAYDAVLAVLDGYGWIEGTVTDTATGLPIPNVEVDVVGDARATAADANGFFRLPLPAATWTLEYSVFGYLTDTQLVKVAADLTANGSFAMTAAPAALVSGVVRDFTNALVDGATISVLGTPITPVVSQPDGSYSISVPDGSTYDIRARKDGLGGDTHSVVVAGATTQDFVLPELTWEDFESGDFQIWPWEMSGTLPWVVDSSNPYEGAYSAKSGAISHNQTSTMEMTLSLVDAGNVTFWYNVSSEATYDFLRFYIDNVQVGSWSGTVPWTQASYPVPNGMHTFKWSYTKDPSVNGGSDAAWVDLIDFPLIGAPAYPEISVSPGSMAATVPPDQQAQQAMTLNNTGDGTLQYSVSVQDASAAFRRRADTAAPGMGRDLGEIELGKEERDPRVGQPPLLGSGGPDVFGYRWIDSDEPGGPVYQWVEINGSGTALSMGDDTYSPGHALGFSFPFYDNSYTSVNISTNGFISFSAPSGSYYTNAGIPSASNPDDIVCAFWDDLNANDGGTVYKYQDTANNRFIVEWDGVPHYGSGGTTPQTFQIILNANGSIVAHYATVTGVGECTVGIENVDGSDGLEVVFNAAYLHDGLAIGYSAAPPVPWLSVSPEAGSIAAQSSAPVTVTYDATGMTAGIYDAIIRVGSNDPDEPITDVPVTLTVGGATDVMVVGEPLELDLGAPQPNPFGAVTSIRYAVPAAGTDVSISVFDVTGRHVRTLVSGAAPAGRHVATWDGRDAAGRRVASGVYFYRMDAGEFSRVRKVTVLK